MPPKDPVGFATADWFAFALTIVLLAGDFLWRPRIKPSITRLAANKKYCFGILFALPIILRLLLLPHHPVPEPEVYDEFSHLLVADTVWHHRLANPPLSKPEFFETFFELQRPTYSSIYSLGSGLALAFGRILTGVPWAGFLITSGALCATCYWMLLGWVSAEWALLGGLLAVIQFGPLCQWTNSYWGGSVAATGGCLVFGALPRLTKRERLSDAMLLGAGFGMHMLARQFQTLLLFLAICLFLAVSVIRVFPLKRALRMATAAALAVLPAVALTLLQNRAVTGDWFTLPEAVSQYQYGVPTTLTFQPLPKPHNNLTPQQEMDYRAQSLMHGADPDSFLKFLLRLEYRVRYYRFFLLPPLYLAFIASLFAMRNRELLCALGSLVIFSLGTNFFPYLLPHYLAAVTGLFVLLSVIGLQQVTQIRIRGREAGTEVVQLLVLLCMAQFACWYSLHLFEGQGISPLLGFETWDVVNHDFSTKRREINQKLGKMAGNLLVFVRYSPQHVYQDEWVWNAADIDSSRVVFARDLGALKNEELISEFPARKVLLLEPDGIKATLSNYEAGQ